MYVTGTAAGVVIYTGRETRSAMNTSTPRSKVSSCFGLSSAGNRTCLVPILTCVCAADRVGGSGDQQTHKTPIPSHNAALTHAPLTKSRQICPHIGIYTFIIWSLLQGFTGVWFIYFIRYIILFSYIIPIR